MKRKELTKYPRDVIRHLGIVEGLQNPRGLGLGYVGLGVRVGISVPQQNPYPQQGFRGMYRDKNICKYHIYSPLNHDLNDHDNTHHPPLQPWMVPTVTNDNNGLKTQMHLEHQVCFLFASIFFLLIIYN